MRCKNKMTFHRNVKKKLFHTSTNIPAFFQYIGWPEGPETDIVASSDSVSHFISACFSMIHTWRVSATALLVELGLFSSLHRSKFVTTCSSIFCPQQMMLWTSQYSELAH